MSHLSSEAIRKELLRRKNSFGDKISKTGRSKDVCLIEIKWFKVLMYFLSKKGIEKPPEIPNNLLFNGSALRKDIQYKVDFDISDEETFDFMLSVFGGGPKITKKFSVHPCTLSPCVILEPLQLSIRTENKGIFQKTVSPDWLFSDLKPHVCRAVRVNVSDVVFADNMREKINETMRIGDYIKEHGPTVRLTKHQRSTHSALLATLPHTFVSKQSSVPSVQSKSLSSTLPQHRLFPFPNGLVNLGNTCFFNASIQCLARLKPLYQYVLSDEYLLSINRTNTKGSNGEIAIQFRNLLENMSRPSSIVNPRALRNAFNKKYPAFANFLQHDAHEALNALLDTLHEDLQYNGESFISKIFYGKVKSTITCSVCHKQTSNLETFMILSLPLSDNSIEECIKTLTRPETLDSKNMWHCDNCQVNVNASRVSNIEQLPQILILQLNRFHNLSKKDDKYIKYDQTLDLSSFIGFAPPLKLVAVIYHYGEIDNGHYTASVLDQEQNKWYLFNDMSANQIRPTEVISQHAYILFYQE